MAFINCGGGTGNAKMSTFEILDDTLTLIDFLNDDRFTCTDNGYPWTQKDTFQYDGINMWSPTYVPDRTTGTETITNNSDKTIWFKVVYITSSEGVDGLFVKVNDEIAVVNWASGIMANAEISSIACVPPGKAITLNYKKDTSATAGKDSAGVILYEIGG